MLLLMRVSSVSLLANGPRKSAPSFNTCSQLTEVYSSSFEYMDWYAGKALIRNYLKEKNKDKKAS